MISFRNLKIECRMIVRNFRTPMPGPTTVTHKHVRHDSEQYQIEHCKTHQNANCRSRQVPRPRNRAKDDAKRHEQQTKRRGEIFLAPQVVTATDSASTQPFVPDITSALITLPTAVAAVHGTRFCRGNAYRPLLALWTLKYDVHGSNFSTTHQIRL
jgi:hypothetical protein